MNVLTLEPNDLFSDEDGHDNRDNQIRVEWLTDTTLREYVTLARLKELQDASVVVHSTGRVALAESLREWVEQLTEALAMDGFWNTDGRPSAN